MRAEKNADAAVIATVKTGEPFTFESENDADWCKVTLASGKSGWMQLNSIRLHFTEKDLPTREKDPAGASEIEQFARGRGLNYAAVTRRAARGDAKALKQFFSLAQDADGAAAESIGGVPTVVYHILGDEKFAKFLARSAVAVSDDGAEHDRERWPHASRQYVSESAFSADGQGSLSP